MFSIFLTTPWWTPLHIYSVFSYSLSNVSGHICSENFPDQPLHQVNTSRQSPTKSDPILTSLFITCQASVRSLSSVEFARWVYLQSPDRLHLLIPTHAHLSPPDGNSFFLTMHDYFHLKIQLKLPFPYRAFLGSSWLRVILSTFEFLPSLSLFFYIFCWLFTVIFHVCVTLNLITNFLMRKDIVHHFMFHALE